MLKKFCAAAMIITFDCSIVWLSVFFKSFLTLLPIVQNTQQHTMHSNTVILMNPLCFFQKSVLDHFPESQLQQHFYFPDSTLLSFVAFSLSFFTQFQHHCTLITQLPRAIINAGSQYLNVCTHQVIQESFIFSSSPKISL